MREDIDPVRWAGQRGVVTLPEHMDTSHAGQIREELLSVIYPSLVEAATGAGKPAVALAVVARPGASWQQIMVGSIVRYGR